MKNEDKTLSEIIERISKTLSAKKIFLFGSRSKGHIHEDSDYDILVLIENSTNDIGKLIDKGHRSLWGIDASVDLLIMTEEEFVEQVGIISSIPDIVTTEGREIYAS